MVLTYGAYSETLENQKERESEVQRLQQKYEQNMKPMREDMNYQFSQIMLLIQQNPGLAHITRNTIEENKRIIDIST